jgi:hypothetical protein
VAGAQIWTVIALLAAAQLATFVEMRRMNDRMTDGFGELRREMGQLRGEMGELRGEMGELRGGLRALRDHLALGH